MSSPASGLRSRRHHSGTQSSSPPSALGGKRPWERSHETLAAVASKPTASPCAADLALNIRKEIWIRLAGLQAHFHGHSAQCEELSTPLPLAYKHLAIRALTWLRLLPPGKENEPSTDVHIACAPIFQTTLPESQD